MVQTLDLEAGTKLNKNFVLPYTPTFVQDSCTPSKFPNGLQGRAVNNIFCLVSKVFLRQFVLCSVVRNSLNEKFGKNKNFLFFYVLFVPAHHKDTIVKLSLNFNLTWLRLALFLTSA